MTEAERRLVHLWRGQAESWRRQIELIEAGQMTTQTNGQADTQETLAEIRERLAKISSLMRLHDDQLAISQPAGEAAKLEPGTWLTFGLDEFGSAINVVGYQTQAEAEAAAADGRRWGWLAVDGISIRAPGTN